MPTTISKPTSSSHTQPQVSETGSFDSELESLMRAIQTNEDSLVIGAKTCVQLQSQSEQIKRIIGGLESVDKTVTTSESTVGRMTSTTGLGIMHSIKEFFFGPPHVKNPYGTTPDKQAPSQAPAPKATPSKSNVSTSGSQTDAVDAALDVLSAQMIQLKEMGLQMGQELDKQNEMLDVAHDAADIAIHNVKRTTKHVQNARSTL